jgi:hypothetical protein
MKEISRVIIGIIIFIALIGSAFRVGILFGVIFLIGGVYALISKQILERPAVAVSLFAGGLITRVALTELLLPIFKTKTILDLVIAIFLFLFVYLIGRDVKNN